jgi:hypothetical protein
MSGLEEHAKAIKAHIEKGDHSAEKAEQHYKAAGLRLKDAKAIVLKTRGLTWTRFLADNCGIKQSWANELIAIGDGRKTLAEVRAGTAKRAKTKRLRDSKPPLRNGGSSEKTETDQRSEENGAIVNVPHDDDGFLNEDGSFADVEADAGAAARKRGFFYRSQQSARGARIDDLKGIKITSEMLAAAKEAAEAWTDLYQSMEINHQGLVPARKPPRAKLSGNVMAESNEFHRELVKFYQSFEPRFGAWFEGKDLPEAAAHSLSSLFQLCGEGFLRLALDALPIRSQQEDDNAHEIVSAA